MSRREWWWALALAIGLTALLTLPYILGHTLARSGTSYTGLVMNPEDSQSYFAKMLQGYDGRWLYTIPFTPEKHDPAFLGSFYIALGQGARWLNLSLGTAWHGARIISSIVLFFTTFAFISAFTRDAWSRWTAYGLAILGSGLGWLLFLLNQPYWLGAFPVDFKMPEAHLFFTALTFPHVALGTALLMVAFWLLWKLTGGEKRAWHYALLAGIVNLILGILYPFIIILVALTIGIYWLYLCRENRRFLWRMAGILSLAFLLPIPLYLYYAYVQQVNEVFRSWMVQAATISPPWPHYLLAFGLMLLLGSLPYLRRETRLEQPPSRAFLWSWVLASGLLLYTPINPQRRFVQGLQVPLAILATAGFIEVVLPALERTRVIQWLVAKPRYTTAGLRRLFIFCFLAFMGLSNFYLLADSSMTAAIRQPYPLFRSESEINAAAWLRANTERSAVVMAAYETGNYLAAHAGNPVTMGHWAETMEVENKREATARFYNTATTDDWRRDFLEHYQVIYLWYGPEEKQLGDFSPDEVEYLLSIYNHQEITLYLVNSSEQGVDH